MTAVKIEQEVGIETILHVCCRDKNLIGLQSEAAGYLCRWSAECSDYHRGILPNWGIIRMPRLFMIWIPWR